MDRNLRTVLHLCKAVEDRSAELYYIYGELHAADAELSRLWKKTAAEEVNHASIINLALNCKDLQLDALNPEPQHYRQLEQLMQEKVAQAHRNPPSPRDALRDAIAFEKRLMECHLLSAAQFRHQAEGRLFETLSGGDKTHLSALEEALARLGG